MIEIRIHGRGGQGNVVAAYLLATAAIDVGRYAQAFPAFGAERRGAPVTAFVRIAETAFSRRCQVIRPAFLIVQDEALMTDPTVAEGLLPQGGILVNATHAIRPQNIPPEADVMSLAATALATEVLGRPVPNTALLAAFLCITGLLPTRALISALSHHFSGTVLERNVALVEQVSATVLQGVWQERARACSI